MKKVLLSAVALLSIAPVLGQDAQVDVVSKGAMQELIAGQRPESFEQKLSAFQKAVNYLDKSRDCLSGIGCTKRQTYLANYLLGAAYGFASSTAIFAFMNKHPEKAKSINQLQGIPSLIVTELGYRSFVKEEVKLWRCLTFRGCTDQTKRYVFFRLGILLGSFVSTVAILSEPAAKELFKVEF